MLGCIPTNELLHIMFTYKTLFYVGHTCMYMKDTFVQISATELDTFQHLNDYQEHQLSFIELISSRYMFSYFHMFSYHPFYFEFHSARVIFEVSFGFYFWNVNRTPTWHLSKMFKVAFKDVSTKNSEPTYWTILFVMPKIYYIYKIRGKKYRRAI